jgi:hypothetical protein
MWMRGRAATLACSAAVVVACSGQPPESVAGWAKDYASTTCSDWIGLMSDAQRHSITQYFVTIFAGTKGAPSAIANDSTTRVLMTSITRYCSKPQDALVAGLGERALLVSTAAAFSLHVPFDPPIPS